MKEKMEGKNISHYKILHKIGEGGMGIVYKAEDTKLKRTVALKFLPVEKLGSKQEKSRFFREAQASAALNHANIATVYEIEEVEGHSFIVMEYIKGTNLKEMIAAGPLKLKKAINIAAQIAVGLQAAHESGVVHRDIKSSNIMITEKEQVKIMDFGLAKLAGSSMLTQKGTTMGTPAYMSPEQTQGEQVDYRTDIWSLGVVLYEMVTGQLPFKGDYEQALIYSIINEDPEPITALRSRVPMELERIVLKCLAKDPNSRYQHASEIPVDLRGVDITSSSSSAIQPNVTLATVTPRRSLLKRISVVLFWAAILVAVSLGIWKLFIASSVSVIHRLTISTDSPINFSNGSAIAISPDGRHVVYASQKENSDLLYLRPLDQFEAKPIEGTQRAACPFFSPDGQWLGFVADGELKKVSVFGGVPISLCKVNSLLGSCWTKDNIIYFSSRISSTKHNSTIFRISANGGAPKMITHPKDTTNGEIHCWPEMLPNKKMLIFTSIPANSHNPNDGNIECYYLETGLQRTILKGGIFGRYSPTGHLVAAWSGGVLAAPFNVKTAMVTGPTVPVLDENFQYSNLSLNFGFSNDGTLIYVLGSDQLKNKKLTVCNELGTIHLITEQADDFHYPVLSAKENYLATQIGDESNSQIWIFDKTKASFRQFTFDGINCFPIWSPEGEKITFSSFKNNRWHLFERAIQSDAKATLFTSSEFRSQPCSWSADGKVLAFVRRDPRTNLDIWLMKVSRDTTVSPFLNSKYQEHQAAISPNGAWIAYVSNQLGAEEIFLRVIANAKSEIKISDKGGVRPVWHPNGQSLYYLQSNKIIEVAVKWKAKFIVSRPKIKFELNLTDGFFSLSPLGDQFLFVIEQPTEPINNLHVVLNWFDELKKKVPTSKKFLGLEF